MEKDEDTYQALKEMGGDIHLLSRNDNDEVIGIEYYANFTVLTESELIELEELWRYKANICFKEKLASQWMVIQTGLWIALVNYLAWKTGGVVGSVFSVVGVIAMIAIIEDKRVKVAKRNLKDARTVHNKLMTFLEQGQYRTQDQTSSNKST